ncbi:MAG: hypothetical protein HKO01_02115 [Flaviramulus sp.]|nr:hypothetical protein [Flaviramulus sp.]NNC49312.1 hypothetical protein [Flaviramulus sp.]
MNKNNLQNIKKPGFNVPKDYFNNLEDVILSEINLKETLSTSGFKTPKDYFETLEGVVIEKVTEKKASKVISLFSAKNLVYISSVAAAILLLFNLSNFQKNGDWSNLDTETVENYMINEDISFYEIAALLSDEDLKEENFIDYNFDKENIENYLLNNLEVEDLVID